MDLISFVNDRLGHDVSYAIDPTKNCHRSWFFTQKLIFQLE